MSHSGALHVITSVAMTEVISVFFPRKGSRGKLWRRKKSASVGGGTSGGSSVRRPVRERGPPSALAEFSHSPCSGYFSPSMGCLRVLKFRVGS